MGFVSAEETEEDRQKARNKERAVLEFFGAIREEGTTSITTVKQLIYEHNQNLRVFRSCYKTSNFQCQFETCTCSFIFTNFAWKTN